MHLQSAENINYEAEVCYYALQEEFAVISAVVKQEDKLADCIWKLRNLTDLMRVERALSETGNVMPLVKTIIQTSGGARCKGRVITIKWVQGTRVSKAMQYEIHCWRRVGGLVL